MRWLLALLLLETVICGGVFTFRYVSDFVDAVQWQRAYWEEKHWRDFYQRRLEMKTTKKPQWDKDPTVIKKSATP